MKRIFVFIFGACLMVVGQSSPYSEVQKKEREISSIYILLDADTRYLRKLANETISRQKRDHNDEITCFAKHLMKSQLFRTFDFRFDKIKGTERFDLTLIAEYKVVEPIYKVEKIHFKGFPNVSDSDLLELSREIQSSFPVIDLRTDFPNFESTIVSKLSKKLSNRDAVDFHAWIEIELNTNQELSVTVEPNFAGCVKG